MLTTLLSLLGGAGGGLLRFIPEIIKFFTDRNDKDHEFRMTQLQLQIDQARSQQQIDLAHVQGDIAQVSAEMQAYVEALKGQATPTGVPWADALSASVRPIVTYWWMAILSIYKLVFIVVAGVELGLTIQAPGFLMTNLPGALETFGNRIWTPDDMGILSMILGFWFVDRAIRKNTGR